MSLAAIASGILALLALGLAYALGLSRRLDGGRSLGAVHERALEALGAGMIVVDRGGRSASSNAEARTLLGLGDGIVARDGMAARGGQQSVEPFRILSALRGIPELAALLVAREGSSDFMLGEGRGGRRIEARAFPFGHGGRGTVFILMDVTENTILLEELSALASQDGLTGVFNRRRFNELGERDIELSRRSGISVGVLMMDLDFFKRVNDEHGHAVGDEVLKAVCRDCQEALRASDVLARYGGEEFSILLPGSGSEECVSVAERLRARIAAIRVPCDGGQVGVTVSLGAYAGVPAPGEALDLYLRRADEALYRSKARGRDRVSYWEPIRQGGT